MPEKEITDDTLSKIDETVKKELDQLLVVLEEREKTVIKFYFALETNVPLTLGEIAQKMNIPRESARKIKEKAIRKLKQHSRSKLLKPLFG